MLYYPSEDADPVRSWDAIREARSAAVSVTTSVNGQNAVISIADSWAKSMELNWNMVKLFHPEKIKEAERRGKGILTNGMFAIGQRGSVSVALRTIRLNNNSVVSDVVPLPCAADDPCAAGELSVFYEFLRRTSDRARSGEDLPTSPKLKVIRLVDLTIAYDQTGNVGGPIDALQLDPDGRITWFQKKKWCPEDDR